MSDLLDLRRQAVHLQIEPHNTYAHATRMSHVIQVLSRLQRSFDRFIRVELHKQEEFQPILAHNPDLEKQIAKDMEWLVVDLNFSSFGFSIAPNLNMSQMSLYNDKVEEWKATLFPTFRDVFLLGDYDEPGYQSGIKVRYKKAERRQIFDPLFKAIGDGSDYFLNMQDGMGRTIRRLYRPDKRSEQVLVPKLSKSRVDVPTKIIMAALEIPITVNIRDVRRLNVKDIKYSEELQHEVYPYRTSRIVRGDEKLNLSLNIKAEVGYLEETDRYTITYPPLEIFVEGDTREEAEEAFQQAFFSKYEQYVLPDKEPTSKHGRKLREAFMELLAAKETEDGQDGADNDEEPRQLPATE